MPMTACTGDYVSWMHQAGSRPSGVSWWGERADGVRHLVYWAVAAAIVAISVVDDSSINADGDRSYQVAAVITSFFGLMIVVGAIVILRETNWLPAWRTLSRLAVTLTVLIGVLAAVLHVLEADIEPTAGNLTPRLIVEYLTWNVADAVPALDVPESFGWDRPAQSADAFVGVAIVLARAFVVFIVLVSVKKLWERVMTDERPPTRRELHEASRIVRDRPRP